jgi:hypothetical protein
MLATLLLSLATSNPPVVVNQPRERQVFQRADAGPTTVTVQVVAPTTIGRLVASVRPAGGGETIAQGELAKRPGGRADSTSLFTAELRVPAGGWYRLGISVDGIAGPLEMTSVERFGVGEVFLVAGQSNSTNHGDERIASQDDRVSSFDGARWALAADPMPGAQDSSGGGSPWPTCGQALVEAWKVPVAFSICGFGGTSVEQWQKDAAPIDPSTQKTLFDGLATRAQALGSFRAILWHQGETDAARGMSRADYAARFRALRDALAQDTGTKAPWVVANVSFVPGELPAKMEEIRAAQQALWKEKVALQGPDTDDLLDEMRAKDRIHFSKVGLEAHGKRWAERLMVLFR